MKLTGIDIEHFGPWNQLSLPLASDSLTVISGSNESGKSALRRFIRGVLFGFKADDGAGFEPWKKRLPSVGSLRVRHRGRLFEIRRAAHDGGSGFVSTRWLTPTNAPASSHSLIEHCDWETDDEVDSEQQLDVESATLPITDALHEVIGDLPEKLFDQVFSLGLRELHELTALADDDVAKAVHGETLGPYGQTLLGARDEMSHTTSHLWDVARQEALPKLLERFEQLNEQIESQARQVERYSGLVRTRRNHERRLVELQSRRAHLQDQLRGYNHIEQVWTPWQRLRNLQADLLRLPRIDDFPEGGITRFDQIEQELHTALKCREALIGEAKQFHRDAKKIVVAHELRRCSAAMRGLLDQREHTARQEERARAARDVMKQQKEKLDAQVQALGADWTLAKLETLDTSVAAHYRLVEKARQCRRAGSLRNKWKQRLVRLSQQCQESQTEIDQALKKLGGLSLEEALRRERSQRMSLPMIARPIARSTSSSASVDPEIEHMQMRIIELEQRRVSTSRQIERLEPRLILPTWVLIALGFFAVGGIVLALLGIVTGVMSSILGGAAYSLIGTVCSGVALALKMQFEQQARDSLATLHEELRENEARLREARESWERLTGTESNFTTIPQSPLTNPTRERGQTLPNAPTTESSRSRETSDNGSQTELSRVRLQMNSSSLEAHALAHASGYGDDSEHALLASHIASVADTLASAEIIDAIPSIESITHHVGRGAASIHAGESLTCDELERLIALQQKIVVWQRKRSALNDRFRAAARELTVTRQQWCDTLKQLGLPESVRVVETFDLWQRLAACNEQRKTWQTAEADFKRHIEGLQNTRSRIVEILHRLNRRDLEQRASSEVFTIWEQDLNQLTATLQERLKLRREERRRRAEAGEYHEKIEDLRLQRSALLRQGCATDRDDYERRATIVARHEALQRQIAATKEELEAASRAIPELAIVEDDLLRFDSSQHSALLTKFRHEASDVDDEIERLHEELGRARHEIEQLETDDEPSDWRLERELVRTQIKAAAEEWIAAEWTAQTIDGIRARYERVCQPGILAAASRYFGRLTEGRFRALWTPLRQRSLRVDDATGNTWRLEQLSGSTRELLLLSIRLALVDEFHKRGFDLPLLLDDVLLTLDPSRAAVAANELVEFARKGHQVLFFTCHPHLASLFTSAGCANIRLSQYAPNAERLAG